MALREQLIAVCILRVCFFSVAQVLVGLLCNFVNVLFLPLGLASLILIIIIIIMGQLHFNCVPSGFPMSLLMPHGMCRNYACCSVVLLFALVSSALMLGDPVAMQMDIVREVQLCDVQPVERESAMLLHHDLEL